MDKMPEKWYQELIKLCKIQSHSDNEIFMLFYLIGWMEKNNYSYTIDNTGNLIVVKGQSKTYPCIVSHIDTVHKCVDDYRIFSSKLKDSDKNILFAQKGDTKYGIGGDDKCGIFACLYFLKVLPSVKIVFFTKEEVGCKGSDGIDLQFFKDCRYIIQLDRRDSSDFIDSKFTDKTVSHQFSSEIGHVKKKYKFKSTQGTITDSINLYSRGVGISCVNISSGYYSPHSANEYIVVDDLWHSVLFTQELIKTLKPKIYLHKKKVYEYKWQNTKNDYSWKQCTICKNWKAQTLYQIINDKPYCLTCLSTAPNYKKCDICEKYRENKYIIYDKQNRKKVCKLCETKAKHKKETKDGYKKCDICGKNNSVKHGHENITIYNEKAYLNPKHYDFVCYICYKRYNDSDSTNNDAPDIKDFDQCSECKNFVHKGEGKYDGELFICNGCAKDTETNIILLNKVCSICHKKINVSDGAVYNPVYNEFICNNCVALYTEVCTSCQNPTPIDLGLYCKGKDFMCMSCITSSSLKEWYKKQDN